MDTHDGSTSRRDVLKKAAVGGAAAAAVWTAPKVAFAGEVPPAPQTQPCCIDYEFGGYFIRWDGEPGHFESAMYTDASCSEGAAGDGTEFFAGSDGAAYEWCDDLEGEGAGEVNRVATCDGTDIWVCED